MKKDNLFLDLYNILNKMGMNGKDLDSMLNALPWKVKERKSDGTIVYICEVKDAIIKHD